MKMENERTREDNSLVISFTLGDALGVALITSFLYLCVFLLDYGYKSYYQIPIEYMDLSIQNLLSRLISILGGIFNKLTNFFTVEIISRAKGPFPSLIFIVITGYAIIFGISHIIKKRSSKFKQKINKQVTYYISFVIMIFIINCIFWLNIIIFPPLKFMFSCIFLYLITQSILYPIIKLRKMNWQPFTIFNLFFSYYALCKEFWDLTKTAFDRRKHLFIVVLLTYFILTFAFSCYHIGVFQAKYEENYKIMGYSTSNPVVLLGSYQDFLIVANVDLKRKIIKRPYMLIKKTPETKGILDVRIIHTGHLNLK
jgi:uncharacterized membrane protein YuzA (DUF378 family)